MEYILSVAKLGTTNPLFFWTLTIIQFVSVGFMIVKTNELYLERKMNQKDLSKSIIDSINSGNLTAALERVKMHTSKISEVASAGISATLAGEGKDAVQQAMDKILLEEQSVVEKKIRSFALIANLATLCGLLGTVYSFASVLANYETTMSETQKSQLFTDAVSMATNCTTYGLIVAVPTLIMYAVFNNRSIRLTDDLNRGALHVFIALGNSYDPHPAKSLTLIKN